MDPALIAAFVSFFALLIGCLVAPTGETSLETAGLQPSASAAD
jgi:hypothetical protein